MKKSAEELRKELDIAYENYLDALIYEGKRWENSTKELKKKVENVEAEIYKNLRPICPFCGTEKIDVKWEEETLVYGVEGRVRLKVCVPVHYCTHKDCEGREGFTGWEAEEIREAVVKRYEKQL